MFNLSRDARFTPLLFLAHGCQSHYEFSLSLNLHLRHVKNTVCPSSADLNRGGKISQTN